MHTVKVIKLLYQNGDVWKYKIKSDQNALYCFIFLDFLMGTYPHSKRAAIISLFLYENDLFLYQLLSKHTSKCIICIIFSQEY